MRRWLPLIALCLAAGSARADGWYFSEAWGATKVKDELGAYYDNPAFRIRLAVGMRRGQWALETFFAGAINDSYTTDSAPYHDGRAPTSGAAPSLMMYGLDLKYIQPIARHLEVYVRGSASEAEADGVLDGWHGRGLGFGAGIQLKGKVSAWGILFWPLYFTKLGPRITGSLWLDEGYEFYRLHGDRPTAIDAQLTHLTLGYAIGSDF